MGLTKQDLEQLTVDYLKNMGALRNAVLDAGAILVIFLLRRSSCMRRSRICSSETFPPRVLRRARAWRLAGAEMHGYLVCKHSVVGASQAHRNVAQSLVFEPLCMG